ncbi:MAG: Tol-Pal system beta propeller repeat protein TolB [Burkholderiaceae bacterium]
MPKFLASKAGSLLIALVSLLCLLPGAVSAQMRLDVTGVGATQYPIAIGNFEISGEPAENVVEVLRADLRSSGLFKIIDPGFTLSEYGAIDFATLRSKGADAVVGGSINRLANGQYDVRFQLTDAVRQEVLGTPVSMIAAPSDLRYAAHQIADYVYEKLTGQKGVFTTRIAFITRKRDAYRLNISDWDGKNIRIPLTSSEPIISPAWSPDGNRIAYVSFETRKPVVYVHTISTGKRIAVANFRGSNSAPAWSPDSSTLAVALTRDGSSQIYLVSASGQAEPKRLVSSSGIDTEPQFAPNGTDLYFSSDRGGSPQIYRINVNGGSASRITFGSGYNVSPRISPDGTTLAYVTRRKGQHFIALKNLESGAESLLSDGGNEESPSFSPNGRWLMYATKSGGRDTLIASSVDGRVRQRMTTDSGDIREPTWGPYGG